MIDPDDLENCIRVLEELVRDRTPLRVMDLSRRIALVKAAGRLSRPDRLEQMKEAKGARRQRREKVLSQDRASRAWTGIRSARRQGVFAPPPQTEARDERILNEPRGCYVCKTQFQRLHFFYDALCPDCAAFNYAKRFQKADLTGKVILITGARVKIGYHASLTALRSGARVVATTRFPRDAAARYAAESDFPVWKDRLRVYGLDLRHSPSVEFFSRHLDSSLERLDCIIHNAAQTVRRPSGFYAHLLERESAPVSALGEGERALVAEHEALCGLLGEPSSVSSEKSLSIGSSGDAGLGIKASARLSQIPVAYEDRALGKEFFPAGRLDADLQQVDLRRMNTWRMGLAEVPTAELIEVHLINSFAPFILNARLRSLMDRDQTGDKHIVNVSAMEGIFSRHTKTDKHPHTNMAKAALNMMTLTSAPDYLKTGIHMNAVDTGWVTDEDPVHLSEMKQAEHDFQPPLDVVDGAARILDPFVSGLLTGEHYWGKFLKDYRPAPW